MEYTEVNKWGKYEYINRFLFFVLDLSYLNVTDESPLKWTNVVLWKNSLLSQISRWKKFF